MFSCSKYGPPLGSPSELSRPGTGGAGRDNPAAQRASNDGPPNSPLPSNSGTKALPESTASSMSKKVGSTTRALLNLAKDLSTLPSGACTHDELQGAIGLQDLVQTTLGTDSVQQLIACIEQSAEADRASVPKCTSRAWYKDFVAHLVSAQWQKVDPSFTPEV